MSRVVIGVDLGGTNVRAGAFHEDGTPAGPSFSNPSRGQEGTDHVLDAVATTINAAVAAADGKAESVGVAIPGHVDDPHGMVLWCPNLGHTDEQGVFQPWRNVSIREPLNRRVGLPITMANDADAAALGEYRFGSGRNSARFLVMLTVGTGIGGGVVLGEGSVLGNAKGPLLLIGGTGAGVELGHTIIAYGGLDCNAGTYGAIEAHCQRDAIIRRAVHRLRRGRPSILHDLVEGDFSRITPRLLSDAAERGDELAVQVWCEVGTYLGVGIGNFINVFAPDVFAIGGQIAKAGDFLMKPAIEAARDVVVGDSMERCRITVAEKIDDAGMLGGAALALK
jgi:glucokinase